MDCRRKKCDYYDKSYEENCKVECDWNCPKTGRKEMVS